MGFEKKKKGIYNVLFLFFRFNVFKKYKKEINKKKFKNFNLIFLIFNMI